MGNLAIEDWDNKVPTRMVSSRVGVGGDGGDRGPRPQLTGTEGRLFGRI